MCLHRQPLSLWSGQVQCGCSVLFGISGISNVLEDIRNSHESAPRVLNEMCLRPLLEQERREVVRKGLEECKKHDCDVTITPEAADWIGKFSEGFPHFIQQYASSAFDTDTSNEIGMNDVMHGAFKENGALDQLGSRYFKKMYSDQINSDEYRKVLRTMAECQDKYVSKQHIREKTDLGETTLGNALRALKTKGAIGAHPEKQGYYKLPTDSFALWIRMQGEREEQQHHSKAF
jgi:biotin operon repressor